MESTIPFSLIILLLSSLSLVSPQYISPDHYFINCGSNSEIDFTGKKFVGDHNPFTFSVSGGTAAPENHTPPPNTPPIYQTARVFTTKSYYELQADEINTFVMVRLHFFPNQFQFSDSKFEVSVSGFNLLSNFNVGNTTLIREFIIPIGSEKTFRIEFKPSDSSSSAFVNAIEAFTTPSDLFRPGIDPLPKISPAGKNGGIENITSDYAFNPIHRINVGGDKIDFTNDELRRNWVPDDSFIFSSEPAKNSTPYGVITFRPGGATAADAPEDVYRTAKQLNNSLLVNITWNFPVNSNTMYLVRAHFCDIISIGIVDSNAGFNFFVYNRHKEPILPAKTLQWLAAPFYVDFVVDSGDSRFVNISIGADRGSDLTPFLNGVEIMELVTKSGFVEGSNTKKKHTTLVVVIGCVIGGVVIVLILLVGFFIGSKYGKVKPAVGAKSESNAIPSYGGSLYTSLNIDFTINHPSPIPNLKLNLRIPFVDILHATNSFDEKLMIGNGGFGTVYKGTLPNGEIVAVKRGQTGHGQGRPEFVTEITVFARIRHRHLVSLIGYCDEKSEMILVYEFMEKGTLQDHLYNANENHPKLSWNKRLEICIGAAQGLHYLHTGLEGGIIHRDVKSTNILLTKQFVAKVADFGISRLGNEDQSEMSGIKGSFGYLDPEYFKCGTLTQKSDVYSFGIVLLEVLCARAALDHKLPEKEINLAEWAIKQINEGNVEDIIDPFLLGTINLNSLRKFLATVGRCLMDTGDERPNMVDVLWDLEYALKLHQVSTDREPYEDSTINTSMQLPMSMIHRLPSRLNDDSNVNDNSALSYLSESQVFSQLNIDGAR